VTPEPSRMGRRVLSHRTCGDTGVLPCRVVGPVAHGDVRALPHREVCLEPRDTWQHRSPSLSGGMPGATGHVAMLELSGTRSGSGATGTRGDTEALPYRVQSLVQWD
jgi:hypothetical protein